MTKKEAIEEFLEYEMAAVKAYYESGGTPDYLARTQAWIQFTDDLHRHGRITNKQFESWTVPPFCGIVLKSTWSKK